MHRNIQRGSWGFPVVDEECGGLYRTVRWSAVGSRCAAESHGEPNPCLLLARLEEITLFLVHTRFSARTEAALVGFDMHWSENGATAISSLLGVKGLSRQCEKSHISTDVVSKGERHRCVRVQIMIQRAAAFRARHCVILESSKFGPSRLTGPRVRESDVPAARRSCLRDQKSVFWMRGRERSSAFQPVWASSFRPSTDLRSHAHPASMGRTKRGHRVRSRGRPEPLAT